MFSFAEIFNKTFHKPMSKNKRKKWRQARKAQLVVQNQKAKIAEEEELKTLAIIKIFIDQEGVSAEVYKPPRLSPWKPGESLKRFTVYSAVLPDDLLLYVSEQDKADTMRVSAVGPINIEAGKSAVLDCVRWCLENNRHRFIIETNMSKRPEHEEKTMADRRARAYVNAQRESSNVTHGQWSPSGPYGLNAGENFAMD